MNNNKFWDLFKESGSIYAYLLYKEGNQDKEEKNS